MNSLPLPVLLSNREIGIIIHDNALIGALERPIGDSLPPDRLGRYLEILLAIGLLKLVGKHNEIFVADEIREISTP